MEPFTGSKLTQTKIKQSSICPCKAGHDLREDLHSVSYFHGYSLNTKNRIETLKFSRDAIILSTLQYD